MEKRIVETLKKKGWSEEDIKKAHSIIEARYRVDKSRTIPTSNKVVFWSIFIVIIILNFLISLTLIPFLMVLNNMGLNFIIVVIAAIFGILFTFMLNLAHISKKHHTIAGIFIPVIAIFNFFFIVYLTNLMNEVLQLTEVRQNPATIGMIYVIAFIAPYLIDLAIKKYIKGR